LEEIGAGVEDRLGGLSNDTIGALLQR